MDNDTLIEKLTHLLQLEVDARHTYRLVADKIGDKVIKKRLAEFGEQHQGHIERLSKEIEAAGGPPPDTTLDIKGYLIEGVTTLMSSAGTRGALQGLKLSEDLTTSLYQEALKWNPPDHIKAVIKTHFSDEKVHLDYIVNNLKALRSI